MKLGNQFYMELQIFDKDDPFDEKFYQGADIIARAK